jgi:hypothetical protein
MVTEAPTAPEGGVKLVMLGVGITVKLTPLLSTPLACTITLPLLAALGTVVTIDVALQFVIVAVVPLNLTVPVPCGEPKFAPVMVIDAPTTPEVEDKLVMLGGGTTVKLTPLLAVPPTVTTTLPVAAPVGTTATIEVVLQLVIVVAVVLLNFTVLDPCGEPKFLPVIVTDAPTAPEVGERLVMLGAAANDQVEETAANRTRSDNRHLKFIDTILRSSLCQLRPATQLSSR